MACRHSCVYFQKCIHHKPIWMIGQALIIYVWEQLNFHVYFWTAEKALIIDSLQSILFFCWINRIGCDEHPLFASDYEYRLTLVSLLFLSIFLRCMRTNHIQHPNNRYRSNEYAKNIT